MDYINVYIFLLETILLFFLLLHKIWVKSSAKTSLKSKYYITI